jgi:hypothetical protein
MALAPQAAMQQCVGLVENSVRFGGTLVINWHDRSLAPERLWGGFYRRLLAQVRGHQVWFARAGEAVRWFRWRRAIRFQACAASGRVTVTGSRNRDALPGAIVRVYRQTDDRLRVEDCAFDGTGALTVNF